MRKQKTGFASGEAKQQISAYFSAAAAATQAIADRHMRLARRLAMKHRIRFTAAQKRQFCKGCWSFLWPGVTSRVRVRDRKTTVLCLICKRRQRIPYRKA